MPDAPTERPAPRTRMEDVLDPAGWVRPLRIAELADDDREELEAMLSELAAAGAKLESARMAHWRAVVTTAQHDEAQRELEHFREDQPHRVRDARDEGDDIEELVRFTGIEARNARQVDVDCRKTIGTISQLEMGLLVRKTALVDWVGAWRARTSEEA